MPRKVVIESTATLKINVGNYESVDVQKTIKQEIEFEKAEEVTAASAKQDAMLVALVKAEAEVMMENLGRKRIMKQGGVDTPVELWKSYVR